ncbi:Group-specific protein [Brevibacillus sp. IT-7CA2]
MIMNRIFLVFFVFMLLLSFGEFILKRKGMDGRQQRVIVIFYTLTIVFLIALQFQYYQVLPTSNLMNFLSPHVKRWVDQFV